jgi:hypothetical protein
MIFRHATKILCAILLIAAQLSAAEKVTQGSTIELTSIIRDKDIKLSEEQRTLLGQEPGCCSRTWKRLKTMQCAPCLSPGTRQDLKQAAISAVLFSLALAGPFQENPTAAAIASLWGAALGAIIGGGAPNHRKQLKRFYCTLAGTCSSWIGSSICMLKGWNDSAIPVGFMCLLGGGAIGGVIGCKLAPEEDMDMLTQSAEQDA